MCGMTSFGAIACIFASFLGYLAFRDSWTNNSPKFVEKWCVIVLPKHTQQGHPKGVSPTMQFRRCGGGWGLTGVFCFGREWVATGPLHPWLFHRLEDGGQRSTGHRHHIEDERWAAVPQFVRYAIAGMWGPGSLHFFGTAQSPRCIGRALNTMAAFTIFFFGGPSRIQAEFGPHPSMHKFLNQV